MVQRSFYAALYGLFLFFTSSLALAYIPPSHFVLKNLVTKHAGFKGFRLRSTVYGMDGLKPTNFRFKQVTWVDYKTRILKSRAYDEAGHELYAVEKKLGSQGITLVDEILLDPSLDTVSKALRGAGIPIRSEAELNALKDEAERRSAEVSQLGRYKGLVAWVLGAAKPNDPQLWIEKDTFIPLRIVGEKEGVAIDARFETNSFFHEFPFPRTVLVAEGKGNGDNFILRDELGDLVTSLDATEWKSPVVGGFTEAGNAADAGVRDLVQKYYKFLR